MVSMAGQRGGAVNIRTVGVTKRYGAGSTETFALRGVNLEVSAGVTMLVGPSGCGKTTLLSVMAGLLEPTAGRAEVLGQDLSAMGGAARADFRLAQMGFIFQQYNLLPSLTAAENAAVALMARGVRRREAGKRAEAVLEQLGLGGKAQSLPRELSGGQQQRVAIARAVVHQPAVVLCDEPTAALDAQSGHAVMRMLAEVAGGAGRTLLVVTHDQRIYHFAERIVHMEDGRVDRVETSGAGEQGGER
jgi:putative ABC transport system ATP-binding protein